MFRDEDIATEVAWVVVYLSALSNFATSILVKNDVIRLLAERLETSNSLQLLIPVRHEFAFKGTLTGFSPPPSPI